MAEAAGPEAEPEVEEAGQEKLNVSGLLSLPLQSEAKACFLCEPCKGTKCLRLSAELGHRGKTNI